MIHRMESTLVYKECAESLKGVDPYTLVYKGCSESLQGVDPPSIHLILCTPIHHPNWICHIEVGDSITLSGGAASKRGSPSLCLLQGSLHGRAMSDMVAKYWG